MQREGAPAGVLLGQEPDRRLEEPCHQDEAEPDRLARERGEERDEDINERVERPEQAAGQLHQGVARDQEKQAQLQIQAGGAPLGLNRFGARGGAVDEEQKPKRPHGDMLEPQGLLAALKGT